MEVDVPIASDRIYTMRQLNQQTADVLKEINRDGREAFVTRRGRFIAMIVPLIGKDIESRVIGAILDEAHHRRQLLGEQELDSLKTTAEVASDLGVNLPEYPDL
jgi:antitoxin (DNA-binding transcriptional repressor) of toxin-antitoxin stability system